MGKVEENNIGLIEKLAMITDASQNLFQQSKMVIIFQLDLEEYKKVQNTLKVDTNHKQFKIDISGTEFIFISDELLKDEKDISSEIPS